VSGRGEAVAEASVGVASDGEGATCEAAVKMSTLAAENRGRSRGMIATAGVIGKRPSPAECDRRRGCVHVCRVDVPSGGRCGGFASAGEARRTSRRALARDTDAPTAAASDRVKVSGRWSRSRRETWPAVSGTRGDTGGGHGDGDGERRYQTRNWVVLRGSPKFRQCRTLVKVRLDGAAGGAGCAQIATCKLRHRQVWFTSYFGGRVEDRCRSLGWWRFRRCRWRLW